MTFLLFSRRSLKVALTGAFSALSVAVAAAPAVASSTPPPKPVPGDATGLTSVDTSWCSTPSLSQVFAWAKDNRWYTLAPGQSADGFVGSGWTLENGAQIGPAQHADGRVGAVLNLPDSGYAISPPMCISSDYPTARAMIRSIGGASGAEFLVAYQGTKTWSDPHSTGHVTGKGTGWGVSSLVNLQPYKYTGWQVVRFAFVGAGKGAGAQIYNFYVDPRMR